MINRCQWQSQGRWLPPLSYVWKAGEIDNKMAFRKKNKFLKTNIIFFKKFSIVFYFKFNLCNLCKIFSFGKRPTWPHIYTFVMMSDHHITTSPYSQVLNLLPQVQCRRKYTGTQCTRLQLWLTFKHSKAYILTDVVLNITASNISVEAF